MCPFSRQTGVNLDFDVRGYSSNLGIDDWTNPEEYMRKNSKRGDVWLDLSIFVELDNGIL